MRRASDHSVIFDSSLRKRRRARGVRLRGRRHCLAGINSSRRAAERAEEYAYQYDDIGNRLSSLDLGTNRTYTANALNQYAQIPNLCDSASLRGNITLFANPVLDGCRVQMAQNFWTFYTAKSV